MDLLEHAISELSYLHIEDKEKEEFVKKVIVEFLGEFSKQEHSYMSAQIVINSFKHFMKDKSFVDKKIEDVIPNFNQDDLVHQLAKKYYELVNTEEFVVYEIDEEWMKRILIRAIEWKPFTPLTGEPDEWYNDKNHFPINLHELKITYQNKRYSAIFASDRHGKDAYNVDGKVFVQNGFSFTNRDSRVPVSFPYEVPDEKEVVYLEDYIQVDDFKSVFLLDYNRYGNKIVSEYTIGYRPSTLDTSIDNTKFHKADYCIFRRYINDEYHNWIVDATFEDMPIYRVRMESRFKEELKILLNRHPDAKLYEDEELTKEINI